jgi:hypothetical protein
LYDSLERTTPYSPLSLKSTYFSVTQETDRTYSIVPRRAYFGVLSLEQAVDITVMRAEKPEEEPVCGSRYLKTPQASNILFVTGSTTDEKGTHRYFSISGLTQAQAEVTVSELEAKINRSLFTVSRGSSQK